MTGDSNTSPRIHCLREGLTQGPVWLWRHGKGSASHGKSYCLLDTSPARVCAAISGLLVNWSERAVARLRETPLNLLWRHHLSGRSSTHLTTTTTMRDNTLVARGSVGTWYTI